MFESGERGDEITLRAGIRHDLHEATRARVDLLVHAVPKTWNWALTLAVVLDDGRGHCRTLSTRGTRDGFQDGCALARSACEAVADTQQAGSDRALHRLRRAVVSQARNDRGWHQAVLHDRDEHGVEDGHLLAR